MHLDQHIFFQSYARSFGPLSEACARGLDQLLHHIEGDGAWDQLPPVCARRQIAYFLATIKHECAGCWRPLREAGRGRGKRYGRVYYGRGYIQLTWQANYLKLGERLNLPLASEPDLALGPEVAYTIAARGMREGWFTGLELGRFVNETGSDYLNARRVINGLDQAERIRSYASAFEEIVIRALIPSEKPIGIDSPLTTQTH